MASARFLTRRIHLWLGLGLGLLFAVLGLTGSALVFYTDIDAALHPIVQAERGAPAPDWASPVWDRALVTGRARRHGGGGKWTFEVTGEGGAIPARYYPTQGHHGDREMIWFSADGMHIVRAEPWGSYLMSWLYQLHMQLLAGDVGHALVGWSGVVMLALLVSGIFAWWPRGAWRKALAFKRGSVPTRRLRDLHKLVGLWSVLPLLALVATGVLLALPDVAQAVLRPSAVPAPQSVDSGGREITMRQALAAAQRALPDGRLVFFDVPDAGSAPIRARFQVPGDPHRRFPGSYVFVDRYSGGVLAVYDVRHGGIGTTMASWVRALHDGSAGGAPVRILAMVFGTMPAILFVTGALRWLRRRRAAIGAVAGAGLPRNPSRPTSHR